MNCLLYARVPADKQKPFDDIGVHFTLARDYALKRNWKLLGPVVDVAEPMDWTKKPKFRNLRRYLSRHPHEDMVVMTVGSIFTLADYLALKTILDKKRLHLLVLHLPHHK